MNKDKILLQIQMDKPTNTRIVSFLYRPKSIKTF